MEDLKSMKRQLMSAAQGQMGNLENVNAAELGEVIDMIKDLEEAIYYCSIVKAMDESKEDKKDSEKYNEIANSLMTEPRYYSMMRSPVRYMDNSGGQHYYDTNNTGIVRNYRGNNNYVRDYREGRSGMTRRSYMENKETHQPKEKQIQELEKYMNELSNDITEMISDATPEEKNTLRDKLFTLSNKI